MAEVITVSGAQLLKDSDNIYHILEMIDGNTNRPTWYVTVKGAKYALAFDDTLSIHEALVIDPHFIVNSDTYSKLITNAIGRETFEGLSITIT